MTTMENQAAQCIVCNEPKPRGITIFGQFICDRCEQEIVNTEVSDERYRFFIERMKRIWLAALS